MNAIDFDSITEECINAFAELTVCDGIDNVDGELKPNIKDVWIPCYFYLDEDERIYIKYFTDEYDIDSRVYVYDEYSCPRVKHVY